MAVKAVAMAVAAGGATPAVKPGRRAKAAATVAVVLKAVARMAARPKGATVKAGTTKAEKRVAKPVVAASRAASTVLPVDSGP